MNDVEKRNAKMNLLMIVFILSVFFGFCRMAFALLVVGIIVAVQDPGIKAQVPSWVWAIHSKTVRPFTARIRKKFGLG